jgi:hypothetical protein
MEIELGDRVGLGLPICFDSDGEGIVIDVAAGVVCVLLDDGRTVYAYSTLQNNRAAADELISEQCTRTH